MKICMIFHRDYPWDVRVEKMCRALIESGHEVQLICNNTKAETREEEVDGIKVVRLCGVANRHLNRMVTLPAFFNTWWIQTIWKATRNQGFDLVLVRDLPLVLPGWFVARRLGIPVLYDMAENYPAMWQNFRSVFKIPRLAEFLEKVCVRFADHVMVVVEESRDRLVAKGLESGKVSIVSNTPELGFFEECRRTHTSEVLDESRLNLLYVGYLTKLRGLDVVIRALPRLREAHGNVFLTIVGTGQEMSVLEAVAKEQGVSDFVHFAGWMDFAHVPYLISRSDVGVIPHVSNEHTNTTIPNKLFDFMSLGKPVLCSDAGPLERIVEETQCGVVFRSGSVDDLVEKFSGLSSEMQRKEMGERGKRSVLERYHWEEDKKRFLQLVEGVGGRG